MELAPVFSPSFLSFVSPASSTLTATAPSGQNQEAIRRKLGTTGSSVSPKELKEEVFGGKDVKADKDARGVLEIRWGMRGWKAGWMAPTDVTTFK